MIQFILFTFPCQVLLFKAVINMLSMSFKYFSSILDCILKHTVHIANEACILNDKFEVKLFYNISME